MLTERLRSGLHDDFYSYMAEQGHFLWKGSDVVKAKPVVWICIILLIAVNSAISVAQNRHVVLTDEELLGKLIFIDKNLSNPPTQACIDCHMPRAGWTSPNSEMNLNVGILPGAVRDRFGTRKAPTASYATFAPVFDGSQGGNFWDGRAEGEVNLRTGEVLQTPATDQAGEPFLNPLEMNNASKEEVCEKISVSQYAKLFEDVWGPDSLDCRPDVVDETYTLISLSIAAYEASPEVNQFSSKFDAFLADEATLTDQEQEGMTLVKEHCGCHSFVDDPHANPGPEQVLFTNFKYFNIGVPSNPNNPILHNDPTFVDKGLGELQGPSQNGKFKTPTLRNVDQRPEDGFVKAYMHNGVFKSLKEVVHFYNARNRMIKNGTLKPEVSENIIAFNNKRGKIFNLGLTNEQEDSIVAFLKTLSDQRTVFGPQVPSDT